MSIKSEAMCPCCGHKGPGHHGSGPTGQTCPVWRYLMRLKGKDPHSEPS